MISSQIHPDMEEKLSVPALLHHIVYGIVTGCVLMLFSDWNGILGVVAALLIGCCLSFFCWIAERLWEYLLLPVIQRPHTMMMYSYRLAIWFLAGGMGYTFGLLIAKKNGLIDIYERPIARIFIVGGVIGVIFQLLMRLHVWYLINVTERKGKSL